MRPIDRVYRYRERTSVQDYVVKQPDGLFWLITDYSGLNWSAKYRKDYFAGTHVPWSKPSSATIHMATRLERFFVLDQYRPF